MQAPSSARPISERSRSRRPQRALLAVGVGLIGTAVVLWFGLATFGAHQICFPPFYDAHHREAFASRDGANPKSAFGADFENVTIRRRDGFRLAGWLVPGDKKAAIILLHGAGGSRRWMLPDARFLHAAGYPVLAIDELDHGDSDDVGKGVGYGWRERGDVLAAADKLRALGFAKVGALGKSQGAAAAILAQAEDPVLAAIVADSSYADLGALLRRQPQIASLNPAFEATMLWETRFWLGAPPDAISPEQAASRIRGCALMVIQGADDKLVPASDGEAIYNAARCEKQLWIVPSAGHTQALAVAPGEYTRRITSFFDRYLLGTVQTPASVAR
jgi:uncharacterized protein